MKKFYTLYFLTIILFSGKLTAQQFQWAKQIGGNYWQSISSIDIDNEGNVYILGETKNNITDLDPGPGSYNLTLPSSFNNNEDTDVFLIKLDSDGNFVWGKGLATSYNDSNQARKVKVGPDGNIYSIIAVVEYPVYKQIIHKHDASGNLLYTKKLYDTAEENTFGLNAISIDIDETGNAYVNGSFYNTIIIDNNQPEFNLSYEGNGAFIIKLDSQGEITWVKSFTDNHTSTSFKKIIIRPDGNLNFLTNRSVQNESQTGWNHLQTLYNISTENGDILWQKEFEKQLACDFDIDPNGNIVIIANFEAGEFDVDPNQGEYILTSETYKNRYILWLSQEGEFVNVIPYYFDWDGLNLNTINFNENGNFYLLGFFENEVTLDVNPNPEEEFLISSSYASSYPLIIEFNSDKSFETAYKLGSGGVFGVTEILSHNQMLYMGGRFASGADFDPGEGEYFMDSTFGGVSYADGYILKLEEATLGQDEVIMEKDAIFAYPNPASENIFVQLKDLNSKRQLDIVDITGKKVSTGFIEKELTINISNLESGMYFIKIEGISSSLKFVKI